MRCPQIGSLWCVKCCLQFCYDCWGKVDHHDQADALHILAAAATVTATVPISSSQSRSSSRGKPLQTEVFSSGPLAQGVGSTAFISTSMLAGSDSRRVERKERSLYEVKYETHERGCTLYLAGDGRMMEMYSEGEQAERESAETTTRIKTGWILKNKLCLTKKSIGSGLLRSGAKEGHGQGLTSRPSTVGSASSGLRRTAENGMDKGRKMFGRERIGGVLSPRHDMKGKL